jgi:hypothetical protein
MDTNTGAREVAEHALLRLVALRVIPSPSFAEVAEIASQVRLPPGSEFSSSAATKKARRFFISALAPWTGPLRAIPGRA